MISMSEIEQMSRDAYERGKREGAAEVLATPRLSVWLLWVTTRNGLVTLGSVVLNEKRVSQHRKAILDDPNVVMVRVEKSEANHLFHPGWDATWQEAFGEEHLQEYARQASSVKDQQIKQLEHELGQCKEDLAKAGRHIEQARAEGYAEAMKDVRYASRCDWASPAMREKDRRENLAYLRRLLFSSEQVTRNKEGNESTTPPQAGGACP